MKTISTLNSQYAKHENAEAFLTQTASRHLKLFWFLATSLPLVTLQNTDHHKSFLRHLQRTSRTTGHYAGHPSHRQHHSYLCNEREAAVKL